MNQILRFGEILWKQSYETYSVTFINFVIFFESNKGFPFTDSHSKCPQQPGLCQAVARILEVNLGPLHGCQGLLCLSVTCCLPGYTLAGGWNQNQGQCRNSASQIGTVLTWVVKHCDVCLPQFCNFLKLIISSILSQL